MKNSKKFFSILFAICVFFLTNMDIAYSQKIEIEGIDTDKYPEVSAYFTVHDKDGSEMISFYDSEFTVTENGIPITPKSKHYLRLSCDKTEFSPPISMAVLVDVSVSMLKVLNKEVKFEQVKFVLDLFLKKLKLHKDSGIMLLPFSSEKIINKITHFTNDNNKLVAGMKNITNPGGGTDFNKVFLTTEKGTGAIDYLKARPKDIRKVIVMLTDGEYEGGGKFKYDEIAKSCVDENITFYSISFDSSIDNGLSTIAAETKGKTYTAFTKVEMMDYLDEILGQVQKENICRLFWDAQPGCGEDSKIRKINIKFKPRKVSVEDQYLAPATSVASMDISNTELLFGNSGIGGIQTRTIKLSAKNADFDISDYTIDGKKDYSVFTLTPAPPYHIKKGQAQNIKVEFIKSPQGDPNQYLLAFNSTPCDLPIVNMIAPCGGKYETEKIFADTDIGSTASEVVTFVNNTPLNIQGSPIMSGANKDRFAIKTGGGAFDLSPGAKLTMTVEFSPNVLSEQVANIEYKITNGPICGNPITVLKGKGKSTSFPLVDLRFGSHRVKIIQKKMYTLVNKTNVPAEITSVNLINNSDNVFSLGSIALKTLQVNEKIDFEVTFNPNTVGLHKCDLEIGVKHLPSAVSTAVTGTATKPIVDADKTASFADIAKGSTSPVVNVSIRNISADEKLHIKSISIDQTELNFAFFGSPPIADINIDINSGIKLPLVFSPKSSGKKTAKLLIVHDGVDGPEPLIYETEIVELSANSPSTFAINTDPIDFGTILSCASKETTREIMYPTDAAINTKASISGVQKDAFTAVVVNDKVNKKDIIKVNFLPNDGAKNYTANLDVITDEGSGTIVVSGVATSTPIENYFADENYAKVEQKHIQITSSKATYLLPFVTELSNVEGNEITQLKYIITANNPVASRFVANSFTSSFSAWTWTVDTKKENEGIIEITGTGAPQLISNSKIKNSIRMNIYISNKPEYTFSINTEVGSDCLDPTNTDIVIGYKTCFQGNLYKSTDYDFTLGKPKQNPVSSSTQIPISIGYNTQTKLVIYDAMGQVVSTLINKNLTEGEYNINLPIENLSSGIYFIHLSSGHFNKIQKLLISK